MGSRLIWVAAFVALSWGCAEGSLESGSNGAGGEMGGALPMTGTGGTITPPAAGGMPSPGTGGTPLMPPSMGPLDPSLPPGTIVLTTSLGQITLVLDAQNAPNTVANFKSYVDEGFYDGDDGNEKTTFHRVISGFMIQGGGVKLNGQLKATRAPIPHEGNTGISNGRGTIAMARTAAPDSATSQFFINHVDNAALDFISPEEPGYVAFGRVTEGMDVVDAIAAVETGAMDVPVTAVTIDDVRRGP